MATIMEQSGHYGGDDGASDDGTARGDDRRENGDAGRGPVGDRVVETVSIKINSLRVIGTQRMHVAATGILKLMMGTPRRTWRLVLRSRKW